MRRNRKKKIRAVTPRMLRQLSRNIKFVKLYRTKLVLEQLNGAGMLEDVDDLTRALLLHEAAVEFLSDDVVTLVRKAA